MVFLPKGRGDDQGIGIFEVLWKVCATVVNCRIKGSVTLHYELHGFRAGRGTGMAILESKLVQNLVGIAHEPLFQVFLDVRKAYDSLDRGRYMEILRGYGMGKRMARLIVNHWDNIIFVLNKKRFLGMPLGTRRGFTQGYPASPMIFNIAVDVVVR